MTTEPRRTLRVAIVLPSGMATRTFLDTHVAQLFAERDDLDVTFVTPHDSDDDRIAELGARHLHWRPLRCPGAASGGDRGVRWQRRLRKGLLPWFHGWLGYGILAYRFNHIHGFAGHWQKRRMPFRRKLREIGAGNFVFRFLGFPFPGSRLLYRALYRAYYSWVAPDRSVEAFMDELKPDVVVLTYLQYFGMRPYWIAARRRAIPIIGIVGSWDRPTTKGPLPPTLVRYVALNQIMRRELIELHGVSGDRIEVIGWPQMDQYSDLSASPLREPLVESAAIPSGDKLILYAGNSPRLVPHESDLVAHIAQAVKSGKYGPAVTLHVRPHPKDEEWRTRFEAHAEPPRITVEPPERGNLKHLVGLLRRADVVISTQGSVSLDAVAMGSCVVNVAFDGNVDVPPELSIRQWYEMDHYRPVIESGGTRVVYDFDELDAAIRAYLDDPTLDGRGREELRRQILEPLDGRSGARLVELIAAEARASGGAQCAHGGRP
ncbi:hypothetical protein KJ567_05140 [Candidatus Bipolaricaulota bacterium]|nr:hypothetical protein [Candidatus Bipolaricaulota bacterium]